MTATRRNNLGPSSESGGEKSVGAENVRRTNELSLKNFMELEPPVFFGTESSEEAEQWLSRIDSLFELLQCSDNCKLRLAAHQLKGDGYKWWLGAKIGLESQSGAVSWDKFKSAFLGFYFPKAKRDAEFTEFLFLRQGDLTVHEYANKFVSLLYYAPRSMQTDEMAKISQFRVGLRQEIFDRVVVHRADSYVELMNMAMSIENALLTVNQSLSSVRSGGTNRILSVAQKSHFKKSRLPMSANTIQTTSLRQSTLSRACFVCGQVGHIARNCPERD